MSYIVSIVREGSPITVEEFHALTSGDERFTALDEERTAFEWRQPESKRADHFALSEGAIDVTTPSDAALEKMQSMALELGARIIGEEGEDLTDLDMSANKKAGGCFSAAAVFGIVLAAAFVLFL
ncbi:MAG: hypothetical protein CL946_04205 [Ectothiorhodospiraceae bacterium]|nr:hypothetical protein [Ectothiorhodospiraceae bacterium]